MRLAMVLRYIGYGVGTLIALLAIAIYFSSHPGKEIPAPSVLVIAGFMAAAGWGLAWVIEYFVSLKFR